MTLRDAAKLGIGALGERLAPRLSRELDEGRVTNGSRLKRAMLAYRIDRARRRGRDGDLQAGLTAFWKGDQGDVFHASHVDYRYALFRRIHAHLIDLAADRVRGGRFARVVEIGCGDGKVLDHVRRRMAGIPTHVGLDVNASALARAREMFGTGPGVSFVEAEATAWLGAHPAAGTILLSYGGVMEYLSEGAVERVLRHLAAAPPAMAVLVEPVAPDHDLTRRVRSFSFGPESSFSHDHARLLEEAGFGVVHVEEQHHDGARWMLLIAVLGAAEE